MNEGRKKPKSIQKVRTLLKAVKSHGVWIGCILRCTGLLTTVYNGAEEIPVSYTHLDVYKRQLSVLLLPFTLMGLNSAIL